ncbi:MAG TPA: flavin reductase family protein [bacterium]|nr:flavin reductase family protein [bacterium]
MKEAQVNEALMQYAKPEPVVFVISGTFEKPNIMPCGWSMRTSFMPPLFAVSIGLERFTHKLIVAHKEFAVAFPSETMKDLVSDLASCSGSSCDKFEKYKIVPVMKGKRVNLPLLEKAFLNLECVLDSYHDTGDHTIFVGKVQAAWKGEGNQVLMNMGKMDFQAFTPLISDK